MIGKSIQVQSIDALLLDLKQCDYAETAPPSTPSISMRKGVREATPKRCRLFQELLRILLLTDSTHHRQPQSAQPQEYQARPAPGQLLSGLLPPALPRAHRRSLHRPPL